MGRIIYSAASSLDGYNPDGGGGFAWAMPDEEVIASLTADAASVSTYLYGRRMYEAMGGWESDPSWAQGSPESGRFAEVWTRAEKVVLSTTLESVTTSRTRIERALTVEAVERARAEAAGDLTVERPTLAANALRFGVVDVVELLICPAVVGGGTPVFPTGVRLDLRLTRERRFPNGMVQVTCERSA